MTERTRKNVRDNRFPDFYLLAVQHLASYYLPVASSINGANNPLPPHRVVAGTEWHKGLKTVRDE